MNGKWLILILWLTLTGFNINKAFHIDDAFHLEAAKWIAKNPLKPMSGMINWMDNPEPLYTANQPPLFFYLVAVVGELFGYTEVPLHLLEAVFTFLALWFFYKIYTILSPSNDGTLLIFLAFCPAMIVNQNLMLDIPLLSLELAFIYYLIKNQNQNKLRNYTLAAMALGAALLIKYSVLPLLSVFVITVLYEKKYKYLLLVLIPVATLSLWSAANLLEFQKIHLLNRHINEFSLLMLGKRLVAFIACLGAVSPFSIALFNGKFPYRKAEQFSIVLLVFAVLFCFLVYFEIISKSASTEILNLAFLINGLVIFTIIGHEIFVKCRNDGAWKLPEKEDLVLILSFTFLAAFSIKYAPFVATRHVLLTLPAILLIGRGLLKKINKNIRILSIISSVALGSLLGISDWEYSNFYRKVTNQVSLPKGSNVWIVGHWGLQWYSQNIAGGNAKQYGTDSSHVKNGDYIIQSGDGSKQKINPKIKMKNVKKLWIEPNFGTFFSVSQFASMYVSSYSNAPWNLNKSPVDTIFVSKVIKEDL